MKRLCMLFQLALILVSSSFADDSRVILATTTSTENSGLLSVLLPPFEQRAGIRVDVVAVGTGAAIRLAENGDADVILVHAPAAEAAFVDAGFGVNRRSVMHNDFVILGPSDDAADIGNIESARAALRRLSEFGKRPFISRGDDSGTHKKEQSIWRAAGIEPSGVWYKEVGQGMGAILVLADEMEGYTISDRGTYLSMKEKINLLVLVEGDPVLYNPYSIIAVNPAMHPHVEYESAMLLIAWITSANGQDIIRNFTRFGDVLFYPDAIP